MNEIVPPSARIRPMSKHAIQRVYDLERESLKLPQVPLPMLHVIHAGMYARTLFQAAGTVLTAALIKNATLLIVVGDALFYVDDDEAMLLCGYNVVPCSAGRKTAVFAQTDVHFTMIFPTAAKTVEEAENEFTDEPHLLASRHNPAFNHVVITGE
jgi:hypothetical protein